MEVVAGRRLRSGLRRGVVADVVFMVVVLVAVWRVWRTCTFDSRCEMGNGPSLLLEWETEGGPYRLSTMTWPGLSCTNGGRSLHGLPKAVVLAIAW